MAYNVNHYLRVGDAKTIHDAVQGQVDDLKSAMDYHPLPVNINKSIDTHDSIVLPEKIKTENNWCCVCVECEPGDRFTITGKGGGTTRLWAFSNSSGTVLSESGTVETQENYPLIAPDNAAYFAFNSKTNVEYAVVRGIVPAAEIENVKSEFRYYGYNNINSLPSGDLNNVLGNESWLIVDSKTYTHLPPLQTVGFLTCRTMGGYVEHTFIAFSGRVMYARRGNSTGTTWTDWQKIGGGEFFQTSASHDTNPFTFSNMPENSYTYCTANRFANKPDDVSGTDHIYMTKSNMTSVSTRSLFQLYDIEAGIWWTCATNNGSIDANGWKKSISINEYTNEYTFNTTNISNTINATPEITTDSHNYLASTGDTTDRTNDINTLLSTGCCHLGPGDFYITGIDMPSNSELIGCGMTTRLILSSSVTSGYAIKLANIATVKDLRIKRPQDITLPDSIGDVHGIVFLGTQTPSDSSQPTTYAPTIENVNIRSFSGGGITCRGTGYGYATSLNVSNVVITNCYAGINIPYFSEFNRFTNINVYACKVGCINNGGNNVFANCGFNGNVCGILMDDSNGQSPNNSHGSYVGCTINHSGSNTGKALDLKGLEAGEVFVGCQIFYGSINIDACNGIRFVGLNTGALVPINVTNSSAIIFSDMQIKEASDMPLTQSNNTTLKFINCFDRAGNVFDPMAN